jgi:amino acid permease
VVIVLGLLSGSNFGSDNAGLATAGFIVVPTVLLLLFRHRYPRWWFDFNVNLFAFVMRVSIYVLLLRDEYPSTEEQQALRLRLPYPEAKAELSRWLPLVKWLLAIPHLIILALLSIAVVAVTLIAWIVIVITGRHPMGLYDFSVGYLRWSARVYAYAFSADHRPLPALPSRLAGESGGRPLRLRWGMCPLSSSPSPSAALASTTSRTSPSSCRATS